MLLRQCTESKLLMITANFLFYMGLFRFIRKNSFFPVRSNHSKKTKPAVSEEMTGDLFETMLLAFPRAELLIVFR